MTERKPPDDLDAYLPDKETAEAVMNGDVEYNREVNPALRARLAELNRLSSNPDLGRPAPPSVAVYAETTLTGGATPDETTLPPKVQVTMPSREESPTQPSLKRLEGEPELPGVVKARREARTLAPPGAARRFSVRAAAVALLAVLVPVLLVIFVMGRATREVEQRGAATAATAVVSAAKQSAPPSAVQSAVAAPSGVPAPVPASTVAPAPSTTLTAAPHAASTALAPAPTGAALKPKQRGGAPDDPYDPAPAVTAVPTSPATSSASPPSAPTVAPTVAPTSQPSAKPPRTPKDDDDTQIFRQPTPSP